MPKITIDTAHAEIAREIRLAKKRMFAAHRAGLPLNGARDAFISEVEDVITEQDYQLRGNPPKAERIARETTGASPSRERHELADAVATILQSDAAPPRLRDAVVAHVTDSEPPTEHVEDQPSAEETYSENGDIRKRAQAIIANPNTKTGHRFHVEEFLAAEKWDDLAIIIEALESGNDREYNEVLVRNDERTLSEDQIETLCEEIASNLESEHMIGYLIALLNHCAAASRAWLDCDNAVLTIRKWLLAHNATAADAAADHLVASALAHLREEV